MPGFWDSEVVLGELQKGNERIRVRQVARKDSRMLDIRTFWRDSNEEWQPSKRGLLIPLELVRSLQDILGEAIGS